MSLELQAKPQPLAPLEPRIPATPAASERLTLMEVWRVLIKQRVVILVVTFLSLGGAAWYAFRTPPVYESVARLDIEPQETPNIGVEDVLEKNRGEESNSLQTEVRILQSDSVLFDTAQSIGILERVRAATVAAARARGEKVVPPSGEVTPPERRAMVQFIRQGLAVTILTGTNLVEIHYRNRDPRLAAAIVNRLVETYSDEDLRTKYERTMHVSDWLQKQLENLRAEASNAQQLLADYQKAHNIVGTDEKSNLTIQTLEQLSSAVDQAEADRIVKEARLRDFNALEPNLTALMGDNPNLLTLRGQLADLQTQKAQLAIRYGPKHPKMVDLQTQINKLQAQLDSEIALSKRQVRSEFESAAGVEQALRKRLGAQEEATYKLNEGVAQYEILRNQAELTRDLYDALQVKLKEATVTAGLSAANITVVDAAQVPYLPVAPRKRLSLVLGLLGGLLGGCVFGFLIESIDDRLQTSDEVENVAMLPSLAAIPHLASGSEKRKSRRHRKQAHLADGLSLQLIALRDSKSSSAEAYRNLRSSLLLSCIDNPPHVIVMTSAFPEEGKTTTAINCAIVLAQRGERVLLVDADLRRGSLGAVFGLPARGAGLSNILANPEARREIPAPLPELPTLHVLTTGPRPPNPAEMLTSTRMEEQLRQWSQEFDRIVLDTAPLLSVSDTQSMSVFADTVVLVTRAGMTRKRALIRARDLLQRINAPIAGVVVNDVNVRLENFYTYRYGMYGYGYRYGRYYGSPYSDRAYGYENEEGEAE